MLSAVERKFWDENGYLVLPKFFSQTEIAGVNSAIAQLWQQSPDDVVVDNLVTSQRYFMSEVKPDERVSHRFKLNDLYLNNDAVRSLSLNKRLTPILKALLGDEPLLINSLNFEKGSEQDVHIDSLFMTPPVEGHMAATWTALENCHPDAGPLRYYPGSHRIPLYKFSNGGFHYIPAEMPKWDKYIEEKLVNGCFQEKTFEAQIGDVFIWHSNLVHGGSAIRNQRLTRKSLVCHFWNLSDYLAVKTDVKKHHDGYWCDRGHVEVPRPKNWMSYVKPLVPHSVRHQVRQLLGRKSA